MLRADACDDDLQLGHDFSVAGGFDFDFYMNCTCGREWYFTDPVNLGYLTRTADNHRRSSGA